MFEKRAIRVTTAQLAGILLASALCAEACTPTDETPDGGPDEEACPGPLLMAAVGCDEAECNNTTGTKTYGIADLAPAEASEWLIVTPVASEIFDNQNLNVDYRKEAAGGLTLKGGATDRLGTEGRRARRLADLQAALGADQYGLLFGEARARRVRAERRIKSWQSTEPVRLESVSGTAVRGRSAAILPKGVRLQNASCTAAAPSCGATSLCVIPSGQSSGTCESALTLKFRTGPGSTEDVAVTVKKVGSLGAIVVDDADTVAQSDIDELLRRFEERIAPMDHELFGEAVDAQGRDRDGNGVTMILLTSKVGDIDPNLAGFFLADDLRDPATTPTSNGADILYMQPPGGSINLDALAGTVAHEYQHIINFYGKVINRQSSQETVWLDEGLSSFAEDFLGYGQDAFKNVAAYLMSVSDTSLTGFGLIYDNEQDADSIERRGMGQLFVRFFFEQKGGASISGGSTIGDGGGAAAVKALVQSADTGIDLFGQGKTGKSFATWLGDFLTAVAVDGAGYPGVSCNPAFSFRAPEVDDFTQFQRGVDLRKSITIPGGTIPLNGPKTSTFEAESVPVPANGGEIRSLNLMNQATKIAVSGPAEDFEIGLRPIRVGM